MRVETNPLWHPKARKAVRRRARLDYISQRTKSLHDYIRLSEKMREKHAGDYGVAIEVQDAIEGAQRELNKLPASYWTEGAI